MKIKKTFKNKNQEQLIHTEKMASLGMIAAGVAHEINNPLSFLLSNVESLELYLKVFREIIDYYEKIGKDLSENQIPESVRLGLKKVEEYKKQKDVEFILSDYENLLNESMEGVFRIREIVQNLKTFSRTGQDEVQSVNVNDCILTALRVISNELKYKCNVVKDFSNIPNITCNPGNLLQVFMNILINASQAIAEKGTIKVKTFLNSQWVCVQISDNGCGISKENIKKLFVPFFSTKPAGQGTGLGLSVSYGIVQDWGGSIHVKSEVSKGSEFTIKLPVKRGKV